jgi:serine/threonine-protein kinase
MRPVAQVGATFAGYLLEEVIGRGGMSEVYRARNPRLGNAVALKLLDPELAKDKLFRERFARESQIAASLEHPNVISIHDAGEAEGMPYIAMRFVDGGSLAELLARGPLPADKAVAVVAQVAGALDAAHLRGLIHRDVKPANILVDRHQSYDSSPHVYLTDFGVAKHTLSRSGLTSTGQFVGTIDYVAPEQIEGKKIDQRTDVYSLGCVLYECLTGVKPFERESNVAVMYAHLLEAPPAVTATVPDAPAALDAVVAKAMAKNPETRYASCGELAAAARAAIAAPVPSQEDVSPVPVAPVVPVDLPPMTAEVAQPLAPPAPETAPTEPRRERRHSPPMRARTIAIAVAFAVAALAAAAAVFAFGGGEPTAHGGDDGGPVIVGPHRDKKGIRVPNVRGQSEAAAKRELRALRLKALVSSRKHAKQRKGSVLTQSRQPNVRVATGTPILLVISLGPKPTGGGSGTTTGGTTTGGTTTGGTTGGGTTTGGAPTRCYDRLGREIPCGSGGGTGTGGGGGGGGGEDHKTCVDRYGRKYPC